jgi:hypothetical protein
MDITPDRATRPSSEANRGVPSVLDGQNRTGARCISSQIHIRYRYRSEGKIKLATAESEFAFQKKQMRLRSENRQTDRQIILVQPTKPCKR